MSGSMRKATARLITLAVLTLSAAVILRSRRRGEVWHTLSGHADDEGP